MLGFEVIIPIFVAVITSVATAVVAIRGQRSESEVEAEVTLLGLVKPLRDRVQELEQTAGELEERVRTLAARYEELEKDYRRVVAGCRLLWNQLVAMGHEPIVTPWDEEE